MATTGDVLIDTNASGDGELVPAPQANQFIRVYHYHVTSNGSVVVKFKSGSTVKDICYGTTVAGGGLATPEYQGGIFDCEPGQALNINLSAAIAVGGALKFSVKGSPA